MFQDKIVASRYANSIKGQESRNYRVGSASRVIERESKAPSGDEPDREFVGVVPLLPQRRGVVAG